MHALSTCTCHAHATHAPRTHQVERLLAEHEVLRQSLIDSKLKHMSAEQELALLRKEQVRHVGLQPLSCGVAASIA